MIDNTTKNKNQKTGSYSEPEFNLYANSKNKHQSNRAFNKRAFTIYNHYTKANGFALPLVIIIGLFLMVSGFAMLARTLGAFRGAIRTGQQIQAQENAERGVARMLQQLNSPRYRYLWVNCHRIDQRESFDPNSSCGQTNVGGWNNTEKDLIFNGSNCAAEEPTRYTNDLILAETISPNSTSAKANRGNWTLEKYTFFGSPLTGGRGVIQVRGTRTNSSGAVISSAVIQHHVQVLSKPCQKKITDTFDANDFPGLLGRSVNLGNNDVIGANDSGVGVANVYCTGCSNINQIQRNQQSVVDGKLLAGNLQLPPVPIFPEHLRSSVSAGTIESVDQEKIQIAPPDAVHTAFDPICTDCIDRSFIRTGDRPMCVTDGDKIAHCLINEIKLEGEENLLIDTKNGAQPVRIYLHGDLTASGQSDIVNNGDPTDLAIFSTRTNCSAISNQQLTLSDRTTTRAFIFAPCATVGIKGGATDAICQPSNRRAPISFDNRTKNEPLLPCKEGDFEGAIWVGTWNGEEGNNAEITVPSDMADKLINAFGNEFSIGASDFVGIGVTDWRSYQR